MIEALLTLALALYCAKTFIDLGSEVGAAALAAWTRRKAAQYRHAIRLEYIGERKINVIKIIREHTGLGLKEAKEAAEGYPSRWLATGLETTKAEAFAQELRGVGAGVVVTMADQVPDGVTVCADRYKTKEQAS